MEESWNSKASSVSCASVRPRVQYTAFLALSTTSSEISTVRRCLFSEVNFSETFSLMVFLDVSLVFEGGDFSSSSAAFVSRVSSGFSPIGWS